MLPIIIMTTAKPNLPMVFAVLLVAGCVEPPGGQPLAAAVESAAAPGAEVAGGPAAAVAPGRVTRIMLGDFFARQQSGDVLIYDVRPAFFHSMGSIPGSINWPKSAYQNQLSRRESEIRDAAAAGWPVVLYCTDLACPDARDIATRLAARGHSVSVLEGGWEAWKAGGLPLE